jgi:dimethylaniline monooxygenase (N-oxide forming)
MPTVAVIGAGPAGLVTARWLQHAGFTPVLFDEGSDVGGQWHVGAPASAVWSGMRTNTSRVTTAFSDLPHPPGTAAYPSAEAMGVYLRRYVHQFGLRREARFRARVHYVDPAPGGAGWEVRWRDDGGVERRESFARVVVAVGRHHRTVTPQVPGLTGFSGGGGLHHSIAYRGAEHWRGMRVLVGGHNTSALEIASELALRGAARVVVAARRHRYVFQRMLNGVPMDHRFFTRYLGMAWQALPPAAISAWLKALLLRTTGTPAQFGAPVHADDVLTAGFTHSPFYLQLVAEGRIAPRPWLSHVDGATAHFSDGRSEEVDAIILCNGYLMDLPCLGPRVREALRPDDLDVDLHQHTFHPALPGFACVGLFEHSGPYFPTLEQQARRLAYAWSGQAAMPSPAAMAAGVEACGARRGTLHLVRAHIAAPAFAREAGVEPDPAAWPGVERALLYGPLSPASFRLGGPDRLPDAATQVEADAAAFGAVPDRMFSEVERAELRALGAARGDAAFSALVAGLR